jgi:Family of unknown function (DUF6364)
MQTKLTLRLDEELIEQAKSYSGRVGKSVSQIVADYFRVLGAEQDESAPSLAPLTESLHGLLKDAKVDEQDYRRYLEEKHR